MSAFPAEAMELSRSKNFAKDEAFLEIEARVAGPRGETRTVPLRQIGPPALSGPSSRFLAKDVIRWSPPPRACPARQRRWSKASGGFAVPYSPEYLNFRSNPNRAQNKSPIALACGFWDRTRRTIYHPLRPPAGEFAPCHRLVPYSARLPAAAGCRDSPRSARLGHHSRLVFLPEKGTALRRNHGRAFAEEEAGQECHGSTPWRRPARLIHSAPGETKTARNPYRGFRRRNRPRRNRPRRKTLNRRQNVCSKRKRENGRTGINEGVRGPGVIQRQPLLLSTEADPKTPTAWDAARPLSLSYRVSRTVRQSHPYSISSQVAYSPMQNPIRVGAHPHAE